jgi:hypothetical protein
MTPPSPAALIDSLKNLRNWLMQWLEDDDGRDYLGTLDSAIAALASQSLIPGTGSPGLHVAEADVAQLIEVASGWRQYTWPDCSDTNEIYDLVTNLQSALSSLYNRRPHPAADAPLSLPEPNPMLLAADEFLPWLLALSGIAAPEDPAGWLVDCVVLNEDCWFDYFREGLTPDQAWDEECSCGE